MARHAGNWTTWAAVGLLALALSGGASSCAAEPAKKPKQRTEPGMGLTIYNSQPNQYNPYGYDPYGYNPYAYRGYPNQQPVNGWAVVKDWRRVRIDKGVRTLRFTDVAKLIDATTVHFESLTDPAGTKVVEQNYEFDLVNADKILEKYIDKKLAVEVEGRVIEGRLLSFDPAQLVLDTGEGENPVQIVARGQNVKRIRFSALPGGLITKPTLVWMVSAAKSADHLVKVTYQTSGISWLADYTVVVNPTDTAADVSGWVTINNQSGAGYPEAELKLVAGNVHRAVAPGMAAPGAYGYKELAAKSADSAAGFTQKSFFEYHLYTLGRPTTIPDRSIKQIELFDPCRNVPARKVLVYDGAKGYYWYGSDMIFDQNYGVQAGNKKVSVFVEFANRKESGMGIPLPAGRARVYKADPDDGSLEFVGEDNLDHTPRDEAVRLKLGESFDVVGERKQTDFKFDAGARWVRETYEIELRNHKDVDQEVLVIEHLYRWSNWIIEKISDDYLKKDSRTIHVPVKVPANGAKKITYTVFYSAFPIEKKGVEPQNKAEAEKKASEEKE